MLRDQFRVGVVHNLGRNIIVSGQHEGQFLIAIRNLSILSLNSFPFHRTLVRKWPWDPNLKKTAISLLCKNLLNHFSLDVLFWRCILWLYTKSYSKKYIQRRWLRSFLFEPEILAKSNGMVKCEKKEQNWKINYKIIFNWKMRIYSPVFAYSFWGKGQKNKNRPYKTSCSAVQFE